MVGGGDCGWVVGCCYPSERGQRYLQTLDDIVHGNKDTLLRGVENEGFSGLIFLFQRVLCHADRYEKTIRVPW